MAHDGGNEDLYAELFGLTWREVLCDSGAEDWRTHWFLDGERAEVRNTPDGMVFSAGPVAQDHGSHGVLWTRESFEGGVRIEFDYTRLDTIGQFVNILYIQATGVGTVPYEEDIAAWSHLRVVPTMGTYFNHMDLVHISYAAFGKEGTESYVRMRRYPVTPERSFAQIAVPPDHDGSGLFEPGTTYHFVAMKKGHDVVLRISGPDTARLFCWNTSAFPPLTCGRIGIRHMFTRCARYGNIRISALEEQA